MSSEYLPQEELEALPAPHRHEMMKRPGMARALPRVADIRARRKRERQNRRQARRRR